ncbi:MAG: glycosyltransferase family 1 protein [Rhizobiaceae bacterium]|nr:glycosyltransferase family 1 protein [Rhizobiaceae bacterium]
MRILIATDAWHPQINGVVRTNEQLRKGLKRFGAEVSFIAPVRSRSIPCPTYPEIRLSYITQAHIHQAMIKFRPDYIHISTEGPIGFAVRAYCLERNISFTTSYHTRFPEYLAARFPVPLSWSYAFLRRFHNAGSGLMVATKSLANELTDRGFNNISLWTRGVNTTQFRPDNSMLFGTKQPAFLYVGRVSVEKNIEAFLNLDLPGIKIVVGDGPQLEQMKQRYPNVLFTGNKEGEQLAQIYASASVFVFPSLTDTFGVVLLEAMASGLPVAAFPVMGPKDIVVQGVTGILDNDLRNAAINALSLDDKKCRMEALNYSWAVSTKQFLNNVQRSHWAPKENVDRVGQLQSHIP